MGAKIKIARIATSVRPLSRPAPPSATAKLAGLYLLALRSHLAQAQTVVPRPKFKLTIPIASAQKGDGVPEAVKISHTRGTVAGPGDL
jgi:hypothetical protein